MCQNFNAIENASQACIIVGCGLEKALEVLRDAQALCAQCNLVEAKAL